jgi:hypothetical protein
MAAVLPCAHLFQRGKALRQLPEVLSRGLRLGERQFVFGNSPVRQDLRGDLGLVGINVGIALRGSTSPTRVVRRRRAPHHVPILSKLVLAQITPAEGVSAILVLVGFRSVGVPAGFSLHRVAAHAVLAQERLILLDKAVVGVRRGRGRRRRGREGVGSPPAIAGGGRVRRLLNVGGTGRVLFNVELKADRIHVVLERVDETHGRLAAAAGWPPARVVEDDARVSDRAPAAGAIAMSWSAPVTVE